MPPRNIPSAAALQRRVGKIEYGGRKIGDWPSENAIV